MNNLSLVNFSKTSFMRKKHGQRYCCLHFFKQACSSGYQTRHGAGNQFFSRLMAVSHLFISGEDHLGNSEEHQSIPVNTDLLSQYWANVDEPRI